METQVNKFEQVSSLGHQMSLPVAESLYSEVPREEEREARTQGIPLYSEVQCIMGNGHIDSNVNRQTVKINIPFLRQNNVMKDENPKDKQYEYDKK